MHQHQLQLQHTVKGKTAKLQNNSKEVTDCSWTQRLMSTHEFAAFYEATSTQTEQQQLTRSDTTG